MRSKFAKPDDGFATIRKNSASEYMIIPEHLEMQQCHSLSLAWKARLPNTLMDLALLSEANVTKEVWILAKQDTNDSETSLKFDHRTLIPPAEPLPTCKAYYSKASKIQEISFSQVSQNHYTWWDATLSSYHVENHLQLEAAMHPHLESCSIFVANPSEFTSSPDTKRACALIRHNTHNRFRSAITEDQFQQTRSALLQSSFKTEPERLQNKDKTRPPLNLAYSRVFPNLDPQKGWDLLLDPTSSTVLDLISPSDSTETEEFTFLKDYRPLTLTHMETTTPRSELLVSSSIGRFVAAGGDFLLKGVTEQAAHLALADLKAAGMYRIVTPMSINKAMKAPTPQSYYDHLNSALNHTRVVEDENILFLQRLKASKLLPMDTLPSDTKLRNGLTIVSQQARYLKDIEVFLADKIEDVGLAFLAGHNLLIDIKAGNLVAIAKSSSVWILSYYLSVYSSTEEAFDHKIFPLPSFATQSHQTTLVYNLPASFQLSSTPMNKDLESSAASCAHMLISQNYHQMFEEDSICETKEKAVKLAQQLYELGGTRIILSNNKIGATKIFLTCSSHQPHTWKAIKRFNLFLLPGNCALRITSDTTYTEFPRTSPSSREKFRFLVEWNISDLPLTLTYSQRVQVILSSILATALLTTVILAYLAFRFRKQVNSIRNNSEDPDLELSEASSTYQEGYPLSLVPPNTRNFSQHTDTIIRAPMTRPRDISVFQQ